MTLLLLTPLAPFARKNLRLPGMRTPRILFGWMPSRLAPGFITPVAIRRSKMLEVIHRYEQ